MTSNEALMKSYEATLKTRDILGFIIDKDTAQIFYLLRSQSNPQLQLEFKNKDIGEFEINGVKLTYQDNSLIVGDNIFEISDEFINFLNNPNVTYGDIEEE